MGEAETLPCVCGGDSPGKLLEGPAAPSSCEWGGVVLTLPAANHNSSGSLRGDWFRDEHVTHPGPMRAGPGAFAENLRILSSNTPHSQNLRILSSNTPHSQLWESSQVRRVVKPSHVILGSESPSWRGKATHSKEPENPRLQTPNSHY